MKLKQFILPLLGLGFSISSSYACSIYMNVRNVKQAFADNPDYIELSISGPFLRTSKSYDNSVDTFSYHSEGSAFSCQGNYNLNYWGLSSNYSLPNHSLKDGYIYYWDAASDNVNGYRYTPMVRAIARNLIFNIKAL